MADGDALHPDFADLWPDSRPRIEESLADIERGLTAMHDGSLDPEVREAARVAAHKLVGTLGTYGLLATSATLREIEAGFVAPASADPVKLRARLDEVVRAVGSV